MVTATSMDWFAVYVKSRHEFTAANDLSNKGTEVFLPAITKQRQWKDRKKLVEFPLFPGYLFVHIRPGPEELTTVLRARGAVSVLSLEPGRPASIPEEEIHSLKLMLSGGADLDIYPHLKEGTGVRVRRGPLKGATGILKSKKDQHMFLVNIELLGRSVGMRINADDVEES